MMMRDQKPALDYERRGHSDVEEPSVRERLAGFIALAFSLTSTAIAVGIVWELFYMFPAVVLALLFALVGLLTGIPGRSMTRGKSKAAIVGIVLALATFVIIFCLFTFWH